MGVNKHRLDTEESLEVLAIDNTVVREKQIARLNHIKQTRDNKKVIHVRIADLIMYTRQRKITHKRLHGGMHIHVPFITQTEESLAAITKCCESNDGNLLALSIEAARNRASVGEITNAMEKVSAQKAEA